MILTAPFKHGISDWWMRLYQYESNYRSLTIEFINKIISMTRIYRMFAGHFRRRNYRALRSVRLNPPTITKAGWSDNCVNLPCNVGATYHEGRRAILPPRHASKNHSSLFPLFCCSCRWILHRALRLLAALDGLRLLRHHSPLCKGEASFGLSPSSLRFGHVTYVAQN